jgi:hypothetical protein
MEWSKQVKIEFSLLIDRSHVKTRALTSFDCCAMKPEPTCRIMPNFRPTIPAFSGGDNERVEWLTRKIQAIESDLERRNLFPLGDKSVSLNALNALHSYWISVRDGGMASDVKELPFPSDRTRAVQWVGLIEGEFDQMREGVSGDAGPIQQAQGEVSDQTTTGNCLSKESMDDINSLVDTIRSFHNIDVREIGQSEHRMTQG